jgi:ABC-type Fe3+/spermidine/putrescine transport system ATPase subunit
MGKDKELIVTDNPSLHISGIYKAFGDKHVLNGITFDINQEEIVALLGPSGCGKSTLLSIIAGIEKPDNGTVYWMGTSINDTPPHLRGFGLMFQDNVLFPHMDVFENVAFGLEMSGNDKGEIQQKVSETLDLVNLQGLEHRNVNSLSGGEQQRVALARSLAPQPRLLMLDEPLGSIDRALRERLIGELRTILRRINQTAIYVTHDQEEAFAIADRVVLMNQGKIEQIGTPEDIFRNPETLFTATFLGLTNLVPGTAKVQNGQYKVETMLGEFPIPEPLEGEVTVLIRPDSASLNGQSGILFEGKLMEKTFRGNLCQAVIEINNIELAFHFLSNTELPREGTSIKFSLDPREAITIFTDNMS